MDNQSLFFILIAILIVGLIVWQYYRNAQRRQELRA